MPIETIVQIIVLSLIVLVPLMLWRTGPSWWAVGGCVAYTASYFIANGFHIAFWILGPLPAETAAAVDTIMQDAPASAYGFALRLYQAGTLLLVALYAGIIVLALKGDLQARLIWLVLAIAEAFALLEYVECKMLVDPFGSKDLHLGQVWGIDVSRYACGRAFGAITPYAAPAITSLYLIWINARAGRSRGS
jgi:hypothetical protein